MHMDLDKANRFLTSVKFNPEITITTKFNEADVIIIYTCAFGIANKKRSVEIIADIMINCKVNARVIVTGCLLKTNMEELRTIITLQSPTFELMSFEDVEKEFAKYQKPVDYVPSQNIVIISEGCRFKCSYCTYSKIFPNYKSRPFDDIYLEVKELEDLESTIYITGAQETSSYGCDLNDGKPMFDKLMDRLATDFPDNNFVIGWFHPAGLTDSVISVIERHKNIVGIMLHIQHVDEEILKAMNRPRFSDTMEKINELRRKRCDLKISSEVIVGFPGETEEKFEKLVRFLDYRYFYDLGVASYEAVFGTEAANMPNQISYNEKIRRMNYISQVFNAKCYPTERYSVADLVNVYKKAQELLMEFPCFILKDNQQYSDIANTDTETKLYKFSECVCEVVGLVTSARTEFDFAKSYEAIYSKYSLEARKIFKSVFENGDFKPAVKERANRLLN